MVPIIKILERIYFIMKYGVGIDVSKGKSTVAILSFEGEVIFKPFIVDHTIEGLTKLDNILSKYDKDDLKIVMEETGTYHLPIYTYLLEKGYFVSAENALKIKKYLDRGIRKVKTDKKDSLKLANYACENWRNLDLKYKESKVYTDMRFLARQYNSFVSLLAQQKVQFSNFCDLSFPGFYQLLDSNSFHLGVVIFRTYFHPDIVKQKSQSQFLEEIDFISKELGHRSIGLTLAKKIYNLAQSSFAPRPADDNSKLIAFELSDTLLRFIKASNDIISKLTLLAKSLPEFDIVSNLPGCGTIITPLIIAEIGDIRRFKNAGSLIAYSGIDSPPYQSGSFDASNRHISKRGNKYLRSWGFMIMKSLKNKNRKPSELQSFIFKKIDEGKLNKVAMIAGFNKFLRIYYGKVKEDYLNKGTWNNIN